jgi:hypothetical protein
MFSLQNTLSQRHLNSSPVSSRVQRQFSWMQILLPVTAKHEAAVCGRAWSDGPDGSDCLACNRLSTAKGSLLSLCPLLEPALPSNVTHHIIVVQTGLLTLLVAELATVCHVCVWGGGGVHVRLVNA